jgi:hypothetical protein
MVEPDDNDKAGGWLQVELFKVIACTLEITARRGGIGGLVQELDEQIYRKPRETALLLIPSFLYLIQNNLLFIAVIITTPICERRTRVLLAACFECRHQLR